MLYYILFFFYFGPIRYKKLYNFKKTCDFLKKLQLSLTLITLAIMHFHTFHIHTLQTYITFLHPSCKMGIPIILAGCNTYVKQNLSLLNPNVALKNLYFSKIHQGIFRTLLKNVQIHGIFN